MKLFFYLLFLWLCLNALAVDVDLSASKFKWRGTKVTGSTLVRCL